MLQIWTFNSYVYIIRPDLSVESVDPAVKKDKQSMNLFEVPSDCVMLIPRLKKNPEWIAKTKKSRTTLRKMMNPAPVESEQSLEFKGPQYLVQSFDLYVGYDIVSAQLKKVFETIQFYKVPIASFRVESTSKWLRKVSDLVYTINKMMATIDDQNFLEKLQDDS